MHARCIGVSEEESATTMTSPSYLLLLAGVSVPPRRLPTSGTHRRPRTFTVSAASHLHESIPLSVLPLAARKLRNHERRPDLPQAVSLCRNRLRTQDTSTYIKVRRNICVILFIKTIDLRKQSRKLGAKLPKFFNI